VPRAAEAASNLKLVEVENEDSPADLSYQADTRNATIDHYPSVPNEQYPLDPTPTQPLEGRIAIISYVMHRSLLSHCSPAVVDIAGFLLTIPPPIFPRPMKPR